MAETCIVCLGDLLTETTESPLSAEDQALDLRDDSLEAAQSNAQPHDASPASAGACLPSEDEWIAHLLPCGHNLHNECLKPWVERANSCPICRASFHEVQLSVKLGGGIISSYGVQDKQQTAELDPSILIEDDLLEPSFEPCMVCDAFGDEEHLMLCDNCDHNCHVFCAGLDEVPSGPWYCQDCMENPFLLAERQRSRQHNRSTVNSRLAPRERALRAARRRADSPWARVWQEVNRRTGIDLDFPFDDETAGHSRADTIADAQRRELAAYQRRIQVAEHYGSGNRFRENAAALLAPITRHEPPAPESQDEIRAWNAFEKAREVATPVGGRRKRKSPTASPQELPPEPERALKRPRTRRAPTVAGPSNAGVGEPSAAASIVHSSGANVRRGSKDRPSTDGSGSNFLQSLLKEVELSTPAAEPAPVRQQKAAIAFERGSSPQLSSPGGSPLGSNMPTPRAMTPPPLSLARPSSPLLSSSITPIFPSVSPQGPEFAPFSPAEDDSLFEHEYNDSGPDGVDQRPPRNRRASHASQLASPPRSKDASPSRNNMSYSAKSEIQRMVKAVLKPLYARQEVNKDEYTDINMNVSRKMYDIVADANNLAEQTTRERWQQVASEEVDKAVKALRNADSTAKVESSPDVAAS